VDPVLDDAPLAQELRDRARWIDAARVAIANRWLRSTVEIVAAQGYMPRTRRVDATSRRSAGSEIVRTLCKLAHGVGVRP
jgi:hypothetical protein